MFTQKYKPAKIQDIVGQEKAISALQAYLKNYKSQKKRGLLLYGPPGSGKTSAVYAYANDHDLEVIEFNASDVRNAAGIDSIMGAAVGQMSLFSKGKIILVDEVDGLSGTKDRGGLPSILKILEKTSFPVVFTMNNPWDNKFSKLRSKTELVAFEPLAYNDIFTILKHICTQEKIKHEDDILKGLARRAGNDSRAAINDLFLLSVENKELTKQALEIYSERNKVDTILTALMKIFKSTDPKVAKGALENVQEDQDTQVLWIDENMPKEYTNPKDRARAYDALSRADVFKRRIRRWQHWRFMIYINWLLTVGIAVAKKERYKTSPEYKPTGRILKMWWANQKSAKKKAIAEKLAFQTHTSQRRSLQSSLPYLKVAAKKNKQFAQALADELELSKDELDWFSK